MLRTALVTDTSGEAFFRWRGGDVSRLEGLTDAVIALALTLVMLSLQIPRTGDELFTMLRQLPAFAVTFAVLAMIWWYHFQFHRRYGLENLFTAVLNIALLFVLLLYVYPLRFLFSVLFGDDGFYWPSPEQMGPLMMIYGGGYATVFGLFVALYGHAWRQRDRLQLDAAERSVTRASRNAHLIHMAVGLVSAGLATALWLGGPRWLGPWSGMVYFAIAPLQGINGYLGGRRTERAFVALDAPTP